MLAFRAEERLPDDDNDEQERTAVVNLADIGGLPRPLRRNRHLLVWVHGERFGQVVLLTKKECSVGRHRDCDLRLDGEGVSRRHARIIPSGESYLVEDLGSANGTFVHGQRITRRVLKDGDIMQFGPTAVFHYAVTDEDHEILLRKLHAASITDALTGAYGREHFDGHLTSELSFAGRHKTSAALVMFDIDHFKRVNDTYGHQAGDAVLVNVARAVHRAQRTEDLFSRYGGEEFAIVLRETDLAGAVRVGERVRQLVESLTTPHGKDLLKVTVSVGCASLGCIEAPKPSLLIEAADRRLYAAKHGGRNRVVSTG